MKRLMFVFAVFVMTGCGGGGGGSAPPSPRIAVDLVPNALDDENVSVSISTQNFDSSPITYNATSSTIFISPGTSPNSFVILGEDSNPGRHTITFSASQASGASATLNRTIEIRAVPTGAYTLRNVSVDGQSIPGLSADVYVTRSGVIAMRTFTDGEFTEKCFGRGTTTEITFSFELWCALAEDTFNVDEQDYRIAGELQIYDNNLEGSFSLYNSAGGIDYTASVLFERFDFYANVGLLPPAAPSLAGDYYGLYGYNTGQALRVDSTGTLLTLNSDSCEISGSIRTPVENVVETSAYVERGIFDLDAFSQTSCNSSLGDFQTGNRDFSGGQGVTFTVPGPYWGGAVSDELLVIQANQSLSSPSGVPSELIYLKICDLQGVLTPFGQFFTNAPQSFGICE